MKQRCVVYANCQGDLGVIPLLRSHPEFSKTYDIEYYSNYKDEEFSLEGCDLLIYQPTKTFEPPPEIKKISFPYLYDDGTFPVHYGTGGFSVIDELLEQGQDPVKLYDEGKIFFNLKERKKRSLEILKERESQCTIKISDFLESPQGQRVPLFFTHNHPTMFLTLELVNRILWHLGMDEMRPETKNIGWLGGCHLDMTGFCHFPGDKALSTLNKSILPLDSYSVCNQRRIFNFQTGTHEDFYIVDNDHVREKIVQYIKNVKCVQT